MRVLVFLFLFTLPIVTLSQARRATALIDKNKTEEAYELLNKALDKDSLAPAEKYVLAGLFFKPDYVNANLDSAYYYILKAIIAYNNTEFKLQTRLANNGFDSISFAQLKEEIEAAGFLRAKEGGNEQDYIDFLLAFPTSIHADSAVILRNIEAFTIAEKKNTYQSYKQFFDIYPQAMEANEARKRYEKLLFENKTVDGKLYAFQQFLKNYPDTWHRREAEQQIYNIITGRNTVTAYNKFVDLYPRSFLKEQAILAQYSLLIDSQQEAFLNSGSFTSHQVDSINLMNKLNQQLLVPIIHNGTYQLINTGNNVVMDQLVNISDVSKCSNEITSPILAKIKEGKVLMNLNGDVLARGEIEYLVDEGMGMMKIVTSENHYFMHISGFRTNKNYFTNAFQVGPYIAYMGNTKWGLESITGIPLLEPKYDSISRFHDNIILNKGKKWEIFPTSKFYPLLDGGEVEIKLSLDHIISLSEDYLLLEVGKKSALMNRAGHIIVPMEEQSIELVEGGFFIDRVDSLLDSRISNRWYYDISFNENWTVGDRHKTKDVYYQGQFMMRAPEAILVGLSAALITLADSTFCFFNDTTKILLSDKELIVPIGRMGQNSSVRHFIYTNKKSKKIVYNSAGQLVDVGRFDKLIDIGDEYILSHFKKSYNLLNDSGKVVLKGIDAATSLDNGYILYLSNKQFGLFKESDSTLITAKYDRPLISYSDSLFMPVIENMYGILNRHDSLLVAANYSEIRYLNDTIAILNSNFRWVFWDIRNRKSLLDNVSDYWLQEAGGQKVFKVFKGIGYGIWTPEKGVILNSTYSEIGILSKGDEVVYIAEKWVEEADIVIMLYYDNLGKLFRKEVLSTSEYEDLTCKTDQE